MNIKPIINIALALVTGSLIGASVTRVLTRPAPLDNRTLVLTIKGNVETKSLESLVVTTKDGDEPLALDQNYAQPFTFRNGRLLIVWQVPQPAPNATE